MPKARSKPRSKASKPKSKAKRPEPKPLPFHAFWSGSLSFGLVNVPVLLFPATRSSAVRLRLMSARGSPLERRFYCPRDGKPVPADEIVRGFEEKDGSYILVDDDELEAIEPQKSREIDLREFVDLDELPQTLLERGYYLAPLKEAARAYRLLAETLEQTRKAGIATFVMRDREYLVAIFARDGILCAETLRFHDEVRDPVSVGLPAPGNVERQRVSAFERAIDTIFSKTLSQNELADKSTASLKAIIDRKLRAGRDMIRTSHEAEQTAPETEGQIDLLETIRESLREAGSKSKR